MSHTNKSQNYFPALDEKQIKKNCRTHANRSHCYMLDLKYQNIIAS